MRTRALTSIAQATGGRVAGPDTEVTSVVVDSRAARPGSLFVALPGERQDGHRFVAEAFQRGATAALVHRDGSWPGPVVRVADTGRALLDLAADERRAFQGEVIGITGSTGKTCTKDLTAAVLSARFRTHASERSFNTLLPHRM